MPFCRGETSKWDVKVTVSFSSCKRKQNIEGTNGGNQIEMSIMQWREWRFHFPLSPLTLRFVKKRKKKEKVEFVQGEHGSLGLQHAVLHFTLFTVFISQIKREQSSPFKTIGQNIQIWMIRSPLVCVKVSLICHSS